jgi:hypothetical protein
MPAEAGQHDDRPERRPDEGRGAAGLLGALMMGILFNVQYAAFGYHSGSLQHGVAQAPAARRVACLLIAGAFGGLAWSGRCRPRRTRRRRRSWPAPCSPPRSSSAASPCP